MFGALPDGHLANRKWENSCSQVLDKLSDDYNFFSDDTEKHMQSPLQPVGGAESVVRLVHVGFQKSPFGVWLACVTRAVFVLKRMTCSAGVVVCVGVGGCMSL